MSEVREKVAYLKGLLAGLGELEDPKSKKIWEGVLEVLDTISEEIEVVNDDLDDLSEYVGSIDDDLAEVEESFYDDDELDDLDDAITVECDNCGNEFTIPEYMLYNDEDVICPHCNASIYDADYEDEDVEIELTDDE